MASKASNKLLSILKVDDDDFEVSFGQLCARELEDITHLDAEVKEVIARVRGASSRKLLQLIEQEGLSLRGAGRSGRRLGHRVSRRDLA